MKGSDNPMWKGGVSNSPCEICGVHCRGRICWECRKETTKNVTLCEVCGKPTSRPEYKVHRACRKELLPKCPICGKPVSFGKTVHVKCLKKQK